MKWTWIWRDLRSQKNSIGLLILNFSLGLIGFLGLDTFKESLDRAIQLNSKNFLSADLGISTRRKLSASEVEPVRKILPPGTQEGMLWEFFTMIKSEQGSRLINIKAVDETYPFFGALKLQSGKVISSGHEKIIAGDDKVYVYPEVLRVLGLKVGDSIEIGSQKFAIGDVIIDDSTQTFRLSSLAPRIYASLSQIQRSDLIARGSTLSTTFLFRFPDEFSNPDLQAQVSKLISDSSIQITTPKDAGQEAARALGYLSDYLGLVSLVGFFLASVGTAFLIRGFVVRKTKDIAILCSLGAQKNLVIRNQIFQLVLIGLVSGLVSVTVSYLLFPVFKVLLSDFFPVAIDLKISIKTIGIALIMGTSGSFLLGYPFLRPLKRLAVASLFQEDSQITASAKILDHMQWIPALLAFYALAIWQASSGKLGSLFYAGFVVSTLLLLAISFLMVNLLKILVRLDRKSILQVNWWPLRHAVLAMTRKRSTTFICVVAIGLGSLLICLIPQIRNNIQGEIETPKTADLPSLFLFDIQPEQVDGLKKYLQENGVPVKDFSMMIRSKLLKINDQDFERKQTTAFQSRDEETDARSRNRGYNLSSRENLATSETLVSGTFESNVYVEGIKELPAISLEEQFAERMGLKIGDQMVFDVQGVEVKGKVTSMRRVKWNSFQPNFFILFQPGVLESAPGTYLAAIPKLPETKVRSVQSDLLKSYSNVSMIEVDRVVQRIFDLSDKMTGALQLMAIVSLICGLIVLYSMVNHQMSTYLWDINLLKIIGGSRFQLQVYIVAQFLLISLVSSLVGIMLAIALSWILSISIFSGSFEFVWQTPIVVLVCVNLLSLIISWTGSYRACARRPSTVLQSNGT